MAEAKEIIGYVKSLRGKNGAWKKKYLYPLLPSLQGECTHVTYVAEQFGGSHWRSEIAEFPEGSYPGHSVAIITMRQNTGLVVDYTNGTNPVIGQVDNVLDDVAVAQKLERLTGYGSWVRK